MGRLLNGPLVMCNRSVKEIETSSISSDHERDGDRQPGSL